MNQEMKQDKILEQERLLDLTKKMNDPKIDEMKEKFVDKEEKLDKEAENLLSELHSTTNEEDDVSEDTEKQIEELENSIVEKSPEEELKDLEEQSLRDQIDCVMYDTGIFQIETSFAEEFELLRKSFIEAVSNVKKWKNEKLVDSNDKVISQEKTSSGIVIQLESEKKVIYSPLTGASKITYPNGKIVQKYTNGDYKLIIPKDRIINYTQKTGLYHVINSSKDKNYSYAFYYIRSGASVKMYKNSSKIQILPSGDKILYKDGIKEVVYENGLRQRHHSNGIKEVFLKDGKKYLTK